MKKTFTIYLSLIFLFLFVSNASAQGVLRGVVYDSLTAHPLVGANVFLIGTAIGSATNIEGDYRIVSIPAGEYTLRFSYLGYKTKEVRVKIEQGKTLVLDEYLMMDFLESEEVIVTGQAKGQVAAINQQLSSNTIVNVVSEERIQELPDVNAAEVIGRLPGVSLLRSGGEANKIVIRGLSDKFGTVSVDGIRIPATDIDSRGIDLSTFSQGSLAGIELYKALTPDKDADAIAGSVNLVTKKAPEKRFIRFDSKSIYNQLNNTLKQYDFNLKYGERFFDNVLGVQLNGNLEQRDRSNERINIDYGSASNNVNDYEITDFLVEYTDEIRNRAGFGIFLDVNTPDNGSIRFNNLYSSTTRDYMFSTRNYPTGSADLLYTARNREIDITTFNSSVRGENHLFGIDAFWGASFGQSLSEDPYDFTLEFTEPSSLDSTGAPVSKMRNVPENIRKGPPELLIPYALNNYEMAYLFWGYYRGQKSLDKEKTAYLDFSKDYILANLFTGQIKVGGKYKHKVRFKETFEQAAAYHLYGYHKYNNTGSGVVLKDFSGTRFQNLILKNNAIISTNFLNSIPDNRNVYDKYMLNPIINKDALREWYELNKNGAANADGSSPEFSDNTEVRANYYDITERVSSAYIMNTLNYGQEITFIAGLRVETEDNDYLSRFTPGKLTGFPTPSGIMKDTSAFYNETIWLPNFHLSVRPLDFMLMRFAAYKAIARPDFNHRLEYYIARDGGGSTTLSIGNPQLKAAKAWNFEVNTSFFSNTIGLFSVSAFYKEIKDMFHLVNNIRVDRAEILDSLGITWQSPFAATQVYNLTYPYNSSKPTKVWGFEVEHQTNLHFLPGLLQNIVLSYNFSIVRSETYIASSRTVTWKDSIELFPGYWIPRDNSKIELIETKQKLEGQPEFFGNFAIGYDIGGFSGRLSMFYQGEFNSSFSGDGKSDQMVNSFTKWDLALKYQVTDYLAVMFNLNNFTNVEEGTSQVNRVNDWKLLNTSERYDLTADLGVRVTF